MKRKKERRKDMCETIAVTIFLFSEYPGITSEGDYIQFKLHNAAELVEKKGLGFWLSGTGLKLRRGNSYVAINIPVKKVIGYFSGARMDSSGKMYRPHKIDLDPD